MIINLMCVLMAMAMALTFLGKSLIGIILGVCVIVSAFIIARNYRVYFNVEALKTIMTAREVIALSIMIIIWMIAAYNGLRPEVSMVQAIELSAMIVGGIFIFAVLKSYDFEWNKFFAVATIIAAIAAVLMLLRPYGIDLGIEFRSSYGSVMAMIMPFAFYLMVSEEPPRKYLWWICSFLIIAGIFASDGRTSWIAFGIFLISVVFLFPIGCVRRRIVIIGMFLCLTVVGVWMGIQSYKDYLGVERYNTRLSSMMSSERPGSGRLIIWDETLKHIAEKPLLGYGVRAARYLEIKNSDEENATVMHVHNAVLEIALETGLLGLGAFVVAVLIFVFGFLRAYVHTTQLELKPKAMAIFLSCVMYGVCSMSLTSIFHAWWFLYLVLLLILLKKAHLELDRK